MAGAVWWSVCELRHKYSKTGVLQALQRVAVLEGGVAMSCRIYGYTGEELGSISGC